MCKTTTSHNIIEQSIMTKSATEDLKMEYCTVFERYPVVIDFAPTSIIRMMEHFLTKQTFRRGMTNYLNELKYKAAEQDGLWEHLTKQGHKVE